MHYIHMCACNVMYVVRNKYFSFFFLQFHVSLKKDIISITIEYNVFQWSNKIQKNQHLHSYRWAWRLFLYHFYYCISKFFLCIGSVGMNTMNFCFFFIPSSNIFIFMKIYRVKTEDRFEQCAFEKKYSKNTVTAIYHEKKYKSFSLSRAKSTKIIAA